MYFTKRIAPPRSWCYMGFRVMGVIFSYSIQQRAVKISEREVWWYLGPDSWSFVGYSWPWVFGMQIRDDGRRFVTRESRFGTTSWPYIDFLYFWHIVILIYCNKWSKEEWILLFVCWFIEKIKVKAVKTVILLFVCMLLRETRQCAAICAQKVVWKFTAWW